MHEYQSSGVTAICLSYRRPANMPRVVSGILEAACIKRVIVCNNNPDVSVAGLPDDPRIELINQQSHMPAATRFFLAAELDGEAFVSVDDDLFLDGRQIDLLMSFLAADPEVPHGGAWGQKIVYTENSAWYDGRWLFPDDEVDVLNRVYAFTKEHALRFVEICASMGIKNASEVGAWDDVVMSHAGARRPRTHDLGEWQDCPSSDDPAIALYKKPGFHESRMEVINRLKDVYANGR